MVKICGACLSMQNIQAVKIKGPKKAASWWRKGYNIEKVSWFPHKNAQNEGIFHLTWYLGNNIFN